MKVSLMLSTITTEINFLIEFARALSQEEAKFGTLIQVLLMNAFAFIIIDFVVVRKRLLEEWGKRAKSKECV